jgi:2-hydroxycyclohexanecarboxyl-CoA dehydrogenase
VKSNPAVVVTGGGGAIGRAVALSMAAKGHQIAIWDLNGDAAQATADELAALGHSSIAMDLDVSDPVAVRNAATRTSESLGDIAVLVTCAGISNPKPFAEIEPDVWHEMLDINLTGTFLSAQALAPYMRTAKYGRMIFISSMAALSGSARHVHYAAAKAGIIGFGKALAKELGPDGVTVNIVAPGIIDTPMIKVVPAEAHRRYLDNPVGRIGRVEDVAHVVEMLASAEAGFTTGAVIHVNGGAYV